MSWIVTFSMSFNIDASRIELEPSSPTLRARAFTDLPEMVDGDLPHEHELLSPINFEVTADTVQLVRNLKCMNLL